MNLIVSLFMFSFLSKTYLDETIGELNLVITTIGFLSILSFLGLEKRIQMSDFKNKLSINLLISFVISFFGFFIIFCILNFPIKYIEDFKILFSIGLIGFSEVIKIFLNKLRLSFNQISFTYSASLISNVTKTFIIIVSFKYVSLNSLLIAYFVSNLFEILLLVKGLNFCFKKTNFSFFKKNKNEILFNLPNRVLNFFNQNILSLIIVFIFDLKILGIFFISKKLLEIPLNLVNSILSDAFLSDIKNSDNSFRITLNYILTVVIIYILGLLIFQSISDGFYFSILPKWNLYYPIILTLMPYIFVRQITSIISLYFFKVNKTQILLAFNLTALFSIFILSIYSSYFNLNFENFLNYFSIISTFNYSIFLIYTLIYIYEKQRLL